MKKSNIIVIQDDTGDLTLVDLEMSSLLATELPTGVVPEFEGVILAKDGHEKQWRLFYKTKERAHEVLREIAEGENINIYGPPEEKKPED